MNPKTTVHASLSRRSNLVVRTALRAGVKAGDRDGDGVLDSCMPPFSRGLPPRIPSGLPRVVVP